VRGWRRLAGKRPLIRRFDIFSRKREKGARRATVLFSARVMADVLDARGRADEAAAPAHGLGGGA
jgi:hypothetical protein